jgi:aspartyl protease family protein
MRSIVWIVTFIISIGVVVAHYADKALVDLSARSTNGSTMTSASSSSEATRATAVPSMPAPAQRTQAASKPPLPEVITLAPTGSRMVTLHDDGRGHFRTEARVEGRRVEFLVDTGATAIVLRASTAAQLGIRPSQNEYTAKVITANGETRAAPVRLNSIEVGDITVRDVRALVQADEALPMDLLGMTFLSRVRWSHDRGKLILEQ